MRGGEPARDERLDQVGRLLCGPQRRLDLEEVLGRVDLDRLAEDHVEGLGLDVLVDLRRRVVTRLEPLPEHVGAAAEDHQAVANQLFSSYAKVTDARSLASVIGEDELSDIDKKYLQFGTAFEKEFVGQGHLENRPVIETLDIGWKLLAMLPKSELKRIKDEYIEKYLGRQEEKEA